MASAQLHQAALDEIGQEIVDGRHPVGSVLTLADLERRFMVSRTGAARIPPTRLVSQSDSRRLRSS